MISKKKAIISLFVLVGVGLLAIIFFLQNNQKPDDATAVKSLNLEQYYVSRGTSLSSIMTIPLEELQSSDVGDAKNELLAKIVDASAKQEHVTTVMLLTALENALIEGDFVAAQAARNDLRKRLEL